MPRDPTLGDGATPLQPTLWSPWSSSFSGLSLGSLGSQTAALFARIHGLGRVPVFPRFVFDVQLLIETFLLVLLDSAALTHFFVAPHQSANPSGPENVGQVTTWQVPCWVALAVLNKGNKRHAGQVSLKSRLFLPNPPTVPISPFPACQSLFPFRDLTLKLPSKPLPAPPFPILNTILCEETHKRLLPPSPSLDLSSSEPPQSSNHISQPNAHLQTKTQNTHQI
jgi:hypothetical protein